MEAPIQERKIVEGIPDRHDLSEEVIYKIPTSNHVRYDWYSHGQWYFRIYKNI